VEQTDIKFQESAEEMALEKISTLLKLRYLERRVGNQNTLLELLNSNLTNKITHPDLSRYLSGKAMPSTHRLLELQLLLRSDKFVELSFKEIIKEHSRTHLIGDTRQTDHSYLLNDSRALKVLSDLATNRVLMSENGEKAILKHLEIDKVLTIEVDGIPIASAIANSLRDIDMTYIRRNPPFDLINEQETGVYIYSPRDGRLTGMYLPLKSIKSDERILIVDDVVSSGSTVERIIKLIRKLGGIPVGIVVLSSHKKITPQFDEISVYVLNNQPERMNKNPS
jgi:adenine/guanine phosphoribosyltransferase-like PRPP-binding protein